MQGIQSQGMQGAHPAMQGAAAAGGMPGAGVGGIPSMGVPNVGVGVGGMGMPSGAVTGGGPSSSSLSSSSIGGLSSMPSMNMGIPGGATGGGMPHHPQHPGTHHNPQQQAAMLAQQNSQMEALERRRERERAAAVAAAAGQVCFFFEFLCSFFPLNQTHNADSTRSLAQRPQGGHPRMPGQHDDDESGDEIDQLSTRTLALARYKRNHDWMNEVFCQAAFGKVFSDSKSNSKDKDKEKEEKKTPYSIFSKTELEGKVVSFLFLFLVFLETCLLTNITTTTTDNPSKRNRILTINLCSSEGREGQGCTRIGCDSYRRHWECERRVVGRLIFLCNVVFALSKRWIATFPPVTKTSSQ